MNDLFNPEEGVVCHYCDVCKGPMGLKDLVEPVPVDLMRAGHSLVRHMNPNTCERVKQFYIERDAEFLKDAGVKQ